MFCSAQQETQLRATLPIEPRYVIPTHLSRDAARRAGWPGVRTRRAHECLLDSTVSVAPLTAPQSFAFNNITTRHRSVCTLFHKHTQVVWIKMESIGIMHDVCEETRISSTFRTNDS